MMACPAQEATTVYRAPTLDACFSMASLVTAAFPSTVAFPSFPRGPAWDARQRKLRRVRAGERNEGFRAAEAQFCRESRARGEPRACGPGWAGLIDESQRRRRAS